MKILSLHDEKDQLTVNSSPFLYTEQTPFSVTILTLKIGNVRTGKVTVYDRTSQPNPHGKSKSNNNLYLTDR